MLQAAFPECLLPDPIFHLRDLRAATVASVGQGQVAQALVVATRCVVVDKGADLPLQIAGLKVVFPPTRFFMVWFQRSILPWVCGWCGAPRR